VRSIRRLPSGRFQACYFAEVGRLHRAPTTFASETEADQFQAMVEPDLRRGTWFDTSVEQDHVGRGADVACVAARHGRRHAGAERTPELKPPTIDEVALTLDAIGPRYRLLVLLGAWSGLRWGELAGLSRQRIDRLHGVIHVVESKVQLGGRISAGDVPVPLRNLTR
jgi:hypothetical protein